MAMISTVFPDWHDPLGVPTVGDDLRVGFEIRIDSSSPKPHSFQMAVRPKSEAGTASKRGEALGDLLQATHSATSRFLDHYLDSYFGPHELGPLRVELKNLLENHRSSLEYVAHYLADQCQPRPDATHVQFPIASQTDTANSFSTKLDKWFPGLRAHRPDVKAHLLSIQSFSGETWLTELKELTNFNKHHSLSEQVPASFDSVTVRYGRSAIRFGELGFNSLTIESGGSLVFLGATDADLILDAPTTLSVATSTIAGADSRLEVVKETHHLYCIPGRNRSIAGTVWRISKNVFQTVNILCSLL